MKRNGFGTRAELAAAWAGVCLWLGSAASWAGDAPRPRVAFDRPGGFTVRQGEAAAVTATLEGGSGGMWFHWEGNNGGTATGTGGETFEIDTGAPGEYWLKATGGSDGTDGDYSGKIRFRVAAAGGAPAKGTRAAGAGETTLLSEDFSGMTSSFSTDIGSGGYNGWTGSKLYNGTNCLKIGSSSAAGNAVSPVVTNAGAAGRVEYSLRKYGSDSTTVEVFLSADGGSSWSSLTNHSAMPSSATSYSAEFGASQTVQFKWQGTGKRFHLGPVAVYAAVPEPEENQPPTIDLAPEATSVEAILGETYSLEVTATDFDGDVVTLDASGLPDGAVWVPGDPAADTVQGLFEWTPAATGTWTTVFSAADKDGTNTATVAFSAVPEGPGTLSFESAAVNARESSGSVALRVLRTGGAAGAVGVAWATMDGTAAAGSEYVAGGGLARFADGQTEATVTVELLDDASPESSKAFTVVLGNVTGGAELGGTTVCTVTIIDDDDANADYYASCYSGGMLKTGETLKNVLCQIINTGVTTNDYGNNLDTILRVTDACPTNKNQVQCIYLQRGVSSFNKEHIWAQSHGIDERAPGYSDLHHLRASDSTMNSKRGNLDFDNCQGKSGAVEYNGCFYISNTAWEPPDSAKGDVARAMLYMDVRYENKYNSKYDLELVDSVPTSTTGNRFGKLGTLLAWNELDPVDAFETNRNELIYARYQGNRNPFIDHPDWARAVFDPSNYVPAVVVWTVSGTVEGAGWVNGADGAFSAEVTNGLAKTFYVQPDAASHYHIGSISWNGALVPQAYYTNAAYYNYTTPAVTNHSTLAVAFAPDLAALGTPLWWLAQHGTNAASVAREDWDAAELEDWNDDGVANWEEYLAGSDPTAFRLRQATGVAVGGETTDGFTVEWDAVANAQAYRVRVCSTAAVEAATAGFEEGAADAGWTVSGTGAAVVTGVAGGAMEGTYVLRLSAAGAWVRSPAVESPVAVEFQYKRSSSAAEWALAVEVCEAGSENWQSVARVTDATTAAQTVRVELPGWWGRMAEVRLRDERTSGTAARYVDAVTVWTSGATVVEGTTAATSWTATGLASGTGYDVFVRAEATTPEETAGPWSEAVRAATAEVVDTRAEQAITFPEIADQTVGATVALGATASSGLAVAYAVAGPATISGTTLTCTGAGTVTVTASQAGDADWKPAESVTRTFEVAESVLEAPANAWASATNAAGFTAEWSAVAGAAGYELEVWKDGTGEDGGEESETVLLGTDFASVTGNGNTAMNDGFIEGWTCSRAYGGTNEIRVGSSSAVGWVKTPEMGATGTVRVVTRARAWSGDSNAVLWVGVTGCASQGNPLSTGSAVFTNDFENIAGSVTVCWSNATASKQRFFLEEVSASELSAGAGGGGGAVPVAGYDPLAVTGTSWEVTGLEAATAYGFHVRATAGTSEGTWSDAVGVTTLAADGEKLPQSIAFPKIGNQVATNTVVLGATASSGLPVAYAVTGNAVETDGILSFTGAGPVTVTASQPGDDAYAPAADAARSFLVAKAVQTVTIGTIGTQFAGATVVPAVSASSGLPVEMAVDGADWDGMALTCTATGMVTVTASQGGNALWEEASASTSFMVVEEPTGEVFSRISGLEELTAGEYVITGADDNSGEWAMANQVYSGNTSYLERHTPAMTVVDGRIIGPDESLVWTLEGTEDGWTLWNAAIGYVAYQGTGNTATNMSEATPNCRWTMGVSNGLFLVRNIAATNRLLRYNVSAPRFACYASNTGNDLAFYKKAKTPQEISFAPIGDQVATNIVALSATADSGLDMAFAVASGPAVLDGNTLTFTGAGEVTVTATQAGNGTYAAASASQTFTVSKASQSIDFPALAGHAVGDMVTLAATADSELSVSYTVSGPATLEGTTLTCTGAGTVTVTATQDGNALYDAALPVERAFEVSLVAQSITFETIGNQVATNIVTLSATADSGLDVAFAVASGPAVLGGNTLTFTGTGEVTVTATQIGNSTYAPATESQTFSVSKASQHIDFPALADHAVGDTVTLAATADSGLAVSYAVSGPATLEGTTLTCTGAGTVTVTASQDGNALYDAALPVIQSFDVSLLTQTIEFDAIGDQMATNVVTLSATADSGLDVTFAVAEGPAAVEGSTLTFTGAGEVTVTATQAGNGTYAAASASQTFTVSKASQSIDFPALAGHAVGDTVTLAATADSGLDVSYAVSGPATLAGSTLTCTGTGTVTVTASQPGNALFAAADDAGQTFEVTEAETPEETAYEAWLRGLGLELASYPAEGTGANGYANWQNYVWDIAPTNTLGLEITAMAPADGNLVLTVPLASERRNYAWVWWTELETGKNPLEGATEVPLGPGAPTMTITNALPDGGFGLLQATIPE